jgi:hypothetical protein
LRLPLKTSRQHISLAEQEGWFWPVIFGDLAIPAPLPVSESGVRRAVYQLMQCGM